MDKMFLLKNWENSKKQNTEKKQKIKTSEPRMNLTVCDNHKISVTKTIY
jgi:hypothetical protein